MKTTQILPLLLLSSFIVYFIAWDNSYDPGQARDCKNNLSSVRNFMETDSSDSITNIKYPIITKALLASRFNTLEELKAVVQIEYFNVPDDSNDPAGNSCVHLRHCSNGQEISSELKWDITQGDITSANGGTLLDKLGLLLKSPFAVANRSDLYKIFNLARRKAYDFGEADVAFYDLALTSVNNITTKELAYRHPRDSSDKGYLNSFNHITAQAFITSCFSEEMADFIADVHERQNMPELTTGKFTKAQLADPKKNHVDNYVDMINNEWGQEIGKKLKKKYKINQETYWTTELLTNYLNDLQAYYSWAFQIGFKPYSREDELVLKYSKKMNAILQGDAPL